MTALSPGEVEAMRAIGERFLAELRPYVEMEAAGRLAGEDLVAALTAKALDCVILAQDQDSLPGIYAGVGITLGRCYGQQTPRIQAYLDDVLELALSVGMDRADGAAAPPEGRA